MACCPGSNDLKFDLLIEQHFLNQKITCTVPYLDSSAGDGKRFLFIM